MILKNFRGLEQVFYSLLTQIDLLRNHQLDSLKNYKKNWNVNDD